jgi:hypothetical protein
MRSKKSADQIKKEGFCAYGSPVDEKKAIMDALKYFGKEKILHQQSTKGELVRSQINEITEKSGKGRLVVWGTTASAAACDWWARANPEHISLTLQHAGVDETDIARYLDEHYGTNCYQVELELKLTETQKKQLRLGSPLNFNTGKRCISPNEIKDVKKCKTCKFTSQVEKENSIQEGDAQDDCKDWTFGDYEIILSGMEDEEDLESMLDCVAMSTKLAERLEKDELRRRIEQKMRE